MSEAFRGIDPAVSDRIAEAIPERVGMGLRSAHRIHW
jgi:hypothetical protein